MPIKTYKSKTKRKPSFYTTKGWKLEKLYEEVKKAMMTELYFAEFITVFSIMKRFRAKNKMACKVISKLKSEQLLTYMVSRHFDNEWLPKMYRLGKAFVENPNRPRPEGTGG